MSCYFTTTIPIFLLMMTCHSQCHTFRICLFVAKIKTKPEQNWRILFNGWMHAESIYRRPVLIFSMCWKIDAAHCVIHSGACIAVIWQLHCVFVASFNFRCSINYCYSCCCHERSSHAKFSLSIVIRFVWCVSVASRSFIDWFSDDDVNDGVTESVYFVLKFIWFCFFLFWL